MITLTEELQQSWTWAQISKGSYFTGADLFWGVQCVWGSEVIVFECQDKISLVHIQF